MNQLSLNPVASPVSTFAPMEVRAGRGGGDLEQLARGLQEFAGGVDRLSDRVFKDQQEADFNEANRIVAANGLQSMNDFQRAVDEGKIAPTNNPWQRIFVSQIVSQKEVRNRFSDLRQQYEDASTVDSSGKPLKFSDSLADVQRFLDQGSAGLFEGRDAWQMQAMHKVLQEERNQFVGRHEQERTQQREIDTRASVTTTLSELMNQYHTAPTSDALNSLQVFAQAATKTIPAAQLRPMLAKAVMDHARETLDSSSAKQLFEKLTINGESLGKGIDPGFWTALDRDIEDRQATLDSRNYQTRRRQSEEAADELFRGVLAAKQLSGGALIDYGRLPYDTSKLDRTSLMELERFTNALNLDEADAELKKYVAAGDTSQKALSTFRDRLLSTLGTSASHVVEMARGWQDHAATDGYSKTIAPSDMAEFEKIVHDRQMPLLDRIDFVNRNSNKLTQGQHKQYLDYLYVSSAPSQEAYHQASSQIVEEFGSDLVSSFFADPDAYSHTENGRTLSPLFQQKALDARNQLSGFYRKLWVEHPELGGAELVKRLEDERTRLFSKVSGTTPEKAAERRDVMAVQASVENGKISGNVVWKDNDFYLRVNGQDVQPPQPLQLFPTASYLTKPEEIAKVAKQLNITGDVGPMVRKAAAPYGEAAQKAVETMLGAAEITDPAEVQAELQYTLAEIADNEAKAENLPWYPKGSSRGDTVGTGGSGELTPEQQAAKISMSHILARNTELESKARALESRYEMLKQKRIEEMKKKAIMDRVNSLTKGTNANRR